MGINQDYYTMEDIADNPSLIDDIDRVLLRSFLNVRDSQVLTLKELIELKLITKYNNTLQGFRILIDMTAYVRKPFTDHSIEITGLDCAIRRKSKELLGVIEFLKNIKEVQTRVNIYDGLEDYDIDSC